MMFKLSTTDCYCYRQQPTGIQQPPDDAARLRRLLPTGPAGDDGSDDDDAGEHGADEPDDVQDVRGE